MNKKYGSAFDNGVEAEFGNTDEINSSTLINIETQDKMGVDVYPVDYSATFPDKNKSRANTATSPYTKLKGVANPANMGDTSPGLPRSMRAPGNNLKNEDSSTSLDRSYEIGNKSQVSQANENSARPRRKTRGLAKKKVERARPIPIPLSEKELKEQKEKEDFYLSTLDMRA